MSVIYFLGDNISHDVVITSFVIAECRMDAEAVGGHVRVLTFIEFRSVSGK